MQDEKRSRYDLRIIISLVAILSIFVYSKPAVVDRLRPESVESSKQPECRQLDLTTSALITVSCNDIIESFLPTKNASDMAVFFFEPIPINQASFTLLQTVKGVGPRLAQEIIDYRKRFGPFSGEQSLKKLAGVGEKRARYLATQFTFE